MKREAAVPVGGLYIIAFLVILGMAGMALYVYLNGQSTARDYRIAAGSLLQVGEEFKRFIDQERLHVIETVLFFLGSQGGVDNIKDYNQYKEDILLSNSMDFDNEAYACYSLIHERVGSPSDELLYKCFNGKSELFINPESQGVWKCDSYMYSYEECTGITLLGAKLCCEESYIDGSSKTYEEIQNQGIADKTSNVVGRICHQGCVNAVEQSSPNPVIVEDKCSNFDYCGALWCKSDNLEIPETYSGVQYYYKIGNTAPGYYCPSLHSYSPEKSYSTGQLWRTAQDTDYIINKLVNLSNKYFYKPSPEFTNYASNLFDADVQLTFQLNFKGCDKERCEFAWVPYVGSTQSFTGRGVGGVPMIEFETNLLSVQTVPVPINDMITYTTSIIQDKDIGNYFVNALEELALKREVDVSNPYVKSLNDWNTIMGEEVFGINCGGTPQNNAGEDAETKIFDLYDNTHCGEDPFNNDCDYNCLMQHASEVLYSSTSNPMKYDRSEGYDYTLRPVFRFVETSLGASIEFNNAVSGSFTVKPGHYHVFVKGSGDTSMNIKISNDTHTFTLPFSHQSTSSYYELVTSINSDLGKCGWTSSSISLNPSSANEINPQEYYTSGFGCCPVNEFNLNTKKCNVQVQSNSYCDKINNGYGLTNGGETCLMNGGSLEYNQTMIYLNGDYTITLDAETVSIDSVDIIRVDYDNTMNLENEQVKGVDYTYGGSHEYYLEEEVSDCTSPEGDNVKYSNNELTYNDLDDVELWYSMLCMRGRGLSWNEIIDEETGLYQAFNNEFNSNTLTQEQMIDEFITNYPPQIYYENEPVLLDFGGGGREVNLNQDSESVSSELTYDEESITLNTMESVQERVYEIGLNTSYMSLPMKWVFAYMDQVSFNQTEGNVGEDGECSLDYEDIPGARGPPDCSCKECGEISVCDFDFTGIQISYLINHLYEFEETFINNYAEYKNAGVVGDE